MTSRSAALAFGCMLCGLLTIGSGWSTPSVSAKQPAHTYRPAYTKAGGLVAPANYRDWVFLTSGFDMTYRERASGIPDHSVFDNVFVNPEAYASFRRTGTWPDRTVMVLETRAARSKGETLVKGGRFQGADIAGIEIHIKDASRFKRPGTEGTWGFFDIKDGLGKVFEPTASCYTCHHDHAAVDTTFVQFYPTLTGIAESKGTISPAYRKDQQVTATPVQ